MIVSNWEQKGRSSYRPGLASSNVPGKLTAVSAPPTCTVDASVCVVLLSNVFLSFP